MKEQAVSRLLVISYLAPSRGHAGGLRLLDLYRELREFRPNLYLAIVTFNHPQLDWGADSLAGIFDEIHRLPVVDIERNFLEEIPFKNTDFDFIDLQYHQCGPLIGACRKRWPHAVVAFSPMESQLRACMISLASGLQILRKGLRRGVVSILHAMLEVRYVRMADRVITVSDSDRTTICRVKSKDSVFCIPTGLSRDEFDNIGSDEALAEKSVVVFFAYFGSQTNQEALLWYCQEVHPFVKNAVGSYKLRVVGRGLTPELVSLCNVDRSDDVDFVGETETVAEGLKGAMVGIAPALSGAGVRGKIHQYAALGIPCVTSPIACESLKYRDGESILVAKDAATFAAACVSLLTDENLRKLVGVNARNLCIQAYAWRSLRPQITNAYSL